jgi:hypothetical protein
MSTQPSPPAAEQPLPSNRAARRRKGKTTDPALLLHGANGPVKAARTTAQGRRINPVRRTG